MLHQITQFQKDAKAMGRDPNSIEELKTWIEGKRIQDFWVVLKPIPDMSSLADIFFKSNIADIGTMFVEGLKEADIAGTFDNEKEARYLAEDLLAYSKSGETKSDDQDNINDVIGFRVVVVSGDSEGKKGTVVDLVPIEEGEEEVEIKYLVKLDEEGDKIDFYEYELDILETDSSYIIPAETAVDIDQDLFEELESVVGSFQGLLYEDYDTGNIFISFAKSISDNALKNFLSSYNIKYEKVNGSSETEVHD